jgi:hypothetical protein
MATNSIKRIVIDVTTENLWFLERYLSVFDFSDIFPADAYGTDETRGIAITFHTDLGYSIETDLDGAKMQIRNRSKHHGWTRWTTEQALQAGDRIVIEPGMNRDYHLSLERKDS